MNNFPAESVWQTFEGYSHFWYKMCIVKYVDIPGNTNHVYPQRPWLSSESMTFLIIQKKPEGW